MIWIARVSLLLWVGTSLDIEKLRKLGRHLSGLKEQRLETLFICGLLILIYRLPTMLKLLSWSMKVSHFFFYCSTEAKTRDHLLMSCDSELGRSIDLDQGHKCNCSLNSQNTCISQVILPSGFRPLYMLYRNIGTTCFTNLKSYCLQVLKSKSLRCLFIFVVLKESIMFYIKFI